MDTNDYSTVFVKVIQHCMGGFNWECCICRTWYEQDHAAAFLMRAGGHDGICESDVHIGDICPECLKAGPQGAAVRSQDCGRELEKLAKAQDEMGELVKNILLDDWATVEEVERAGQFDQEGQ
ncbi:MAG: hypothetical protein M3R47_02070 [Chloroflexota bacterium]|nr:hypothetical protein [Chloroflexota bacterium]